MFSPTTSDIKKLDQRNGRPTMREQSGPQVATATAGLSTPILSKDYGGYYNGTFYRTNGYRKLVREMRCDPTISFLRELAIAPIVAAEWSIGREPDAPEGAVEFIDKQLQSNRDHLLEHAIAGCIDYGWQTFETVLARKEGQIVIEKLKPLVEEITEILVNRSNGEYIGVRQTGNYDYSNRRDQFQVKNVDNHLVTGTTFIKAKDCPLFNIGVEGTYWYGRPLLINALVPYTGWNNANESADRYDTKIAGSHFVIHYPYGTGTLDGIEVDNFEIAKRLINTIEASGAITVPRHVDETIAELNKDTPDAWKIELLSDTSSQQSSFVDRLKYYDNLKARALHFPERSVLEGRFGTKAEASQHADFAIVLLEFRHERMTRLASNQIVNNLMLYNYGRESVGTVYLKPSPISDDKRGFLKELFMEILQRDLALVVRNIDMAELRERLGLPVISVENEADLNDPKELEDLVRRQQPLAVNLMQQNNEGHESENPIERERKQSTERIDTSI